MDPGNNVAKVVFEEIIVIYYAFSLEHVYVQSQRLSSYHYGY